MTPIIALDATSLRAEAYGIGRYTRNLLARMVALRPEWQWICYAHQDVHQGDTPDGTLLRRCWVGGHIGRLTALGVCFPSWLALDRPHLFWGPAHRLPLWLPADTARVVTIHDLVWKRAPETMRGVTRALDSLLMPRALRKADRAIAVSNATASDIADFFPEAKHKVSVVLVGASRLPDPQPVEGLEAMGVKKPYVLFVGTLEPRKNLPRLLEAFAALPIDLAGGVKLVIAGTKGWGTDEISQQLARWELGNRVRLVGRVRDEELATLYRHAICLAMPSLYEGFGSPLVEAMSLGTPVLTSSVSSMPEVAGEAGILVNPLDVRSITEGLARIIGIPPLREDLRAKTRAQAAKFCWDQAAEMTLKVFETAMAERGWLRFQFKHQ
jgi:glycosyltransferase involved in cell wall biosynthesis